MSICAAFVGVFEVLDYHNDESFPNLIDTLEQFNNGFGLYKEGKFDKAIVSFGIFSLFSNGVKIYCFD